MAEAVVLKEENKKLAAEAAVHNRRIAATEKAVSDEKIDKKGHNSN